MISIVLPTFNGEKYIREAIDSILEQTEKDFELVIVNDCSTDNTLNIIEDYAKRDNRIKVVTNKINCKLPKSLNIGFDLCSGDYFTWTSDDNMYKKNALEKMKNKLDGETETGVVYANCDIIDGRGKIVTLAHNNESNISIYVANNIGACFMYRREVHERLKGYNIDKFLVEDYDFWIRAYRYFKFEHINESLYLYRQHSGSLTEERKKDIVEKTNELLIDNLSNKFISELDRLIIYKRLANSYYYYYNPSKLRYFLQQLREISPTEYRNYDIIQRTAQYIDKRFLEKIIEIYRKTTFKKVKH